MTAVDLLAHLQIPSPLRPVGHIFALKVSAVECNYHLISSLVTWRARLSDAEPAADDRPADACVPMAPVCNTCARINNPGHARLKLALAAQGWGNASVLQLPADEYGVRLVPSKLELLCCARVVMFRRVMYLYPGQEMSRTFLRGHITSMVHDGWSAIARGEAELAAVPRTDLADLFSIVFRGTNGSWTRLCAQLNDDVRDLQLRASVVLHLLRTYKAVRHPGFADWQDPGESADAVAAVQVALDVQRDGIVARLDGAR